MDRITIWARSEGDQSMAHGHTSFLLLVSALLVNISCTHTARLDATAPTIIAPEPLSDVHTPTPRAMTSAVWTGGAMIIWGGVGANNDRLNKSEGAMYFPEEKRWKAIPKAEVTSRFHHSAVWTGKYLAVWGGVDSRSNDRLGSGWLYDPETQVWRPMSSDQAPSPRSGHSAVWTGSHMIVWGGESDDGVLQDGAMYEPKTDRWVALSNDDAPAARSFHSVNWSGSKMLVWGGIGANGNLGSGALFDPTTNTWSAITNVGAPIGRVSHSAVWTGTSLIVWGGRQDSEHFLNDGGSYDPLTDRWQPIAATEATPSPRELHSTVWTDQEMVIWGGQNDEKTFAGGAAFNPATNSWRKLKDTGKSVARSQHAAIWTGSEMLVFGGRSKKGKLVVNKIGIEIPLNLAAEKIQAH